MSLQSLGWSAFFQKQLTPGEALSPARISGVHLTEYALLTADGDSRAVLSGKLRHEIECGRDRWPVTGDWVLTDTRESVVVMRSILKARGHISRKVPGEVTLEQVLVANVDLVFILTGLDRDYNLSRIERYVTAVQDSGADVILLLNKADLDPHASERVCEVRSAFPVTPVIAVSALDGQGLDTLSFYLEPGKTACVLGSSGAGKSTLTNRLLGADLQSTREVGFRGRHTTTTRELFVLPGGALWIDTPGLRELQLWSREESADSAFPDVETLAGGCRFRDCAHEEEPDCAVRAALASGELDPRRFRNYQKMKRELTYLALRQNETAARIEKMRWKQIHKQLKQRYRE